MEEREWLINTDRLQKAVDVYERLVKVNHVDRASLMDCIQNARNEQNETWADHCLRNKWGIK